VIDNKNYIPLGSGLCTENCSTTFLSNLKWKSMSDQKFATARLYF